MAGVCKGHHDVPAEEADGLTIFWRPSHGESSTELGDLPIWRLHFDTLEMPRHITYGTEWCAPCD
jgi:hypothetical protein